MTDIPVSSGTSIAQQPTLWKTIHKPVIILLAIVAIIQVASLVMTFQGLSVEDELLVESTVGQLAIWIADQTENDVEDIESPLALYAKNLSRSEGGTLPAESILSFMQTGILVWGAVVLLLMLIGLILLQRNRVQSRRGFLLALLILDSMLFIIPVVDEFNILLILLSAIIVILMVLLAIPGDVSRIMGFFVAVSVLFVAWEGAKLIANLIDYRVVIHQPAWEYETYPSLNETLSALEQGEVDYVIADRNDLDELMLPHPADDELSLEDFPYTNLRYLANLNRAEGVGFLPIQPEFPGRLSVAVRADIAGEVNAIREIFGNRVATVDGEFADDRFLPQPRELVLLDLKILNDLNLPHLQMIAEAFLQPARRNGSLLLVRILGDAGIFTLSEAVFGFLFGATFGFILGSLFAHSSLMERGLLPYVVASQTIPILAIAPMVVIWLGASAISVAVIAAYLTFFPVTINTLRGLQSPKTTEIELMRSYAASKWTIMWKLRFPSALPYIFTALKVSATASVVGAIIGELPSGIGDGLGRAILDFSSDYSAISTPKLWASIVMAALVGILFFVVVSLIERLALRGYIRTID